MALRFVARVGRTDVRVALVGERLRIGSAPDCEIRLADPTVSREHALLEADGDGWRLTDLGSRNGTRVGDQSLAAGADAQVRAGSRLRFGQVGAELQELEDNELELAVPGQEAPALARPAPSATTLATGDLGSFCLHRLPALLQRLGDGADLGVLAPALAEAIAASLAGTRVEVRGEREGRTALLACAGDALPEPREVRSGHEGRLGLEISRAPGADMHAADALLRLGLSLLRAADRAPSALPPAARAPLSPPEVPEPGTQDPRLREVYRQAAVLGGGDVNVVIEGESGTGKELLARYLHAAGGADRPWVALNCASLPRDLLEAELFGIDRGVATGVEARPGKFELAHGGTLFLDEIGDMAPESQAKILRVLQEREVYRLGSSRPRPAEVRVVAATNRSLEAMVEEGGFRLDLFHRLADWVVRLPALRERRGDVANLAAHFLSRACARRGIRFGGISRAALDTLEAAPWPGNVRELEREMQRVALFLNDGEVLQSDQLQDRVRRPAAVPDGASLADRLRVHEAAIIRDALDRHGGDVGEAARSLGVGRSTLYRRVAELGLSG